MRISTSPPGLDEPPDSVDQAHVETPEPPAAFPPFATQPEERIQRSLFGEILDWLLVPLLLLWPLSIAITYLIAKSIANQPFDRTLDNRVTVLAQQVKVQNGKLVLQLSNSARDILRADDVDNVYFQVLGSRGEHIEGDHEIPPPGDNGKAPFWTVQFRDDTIHNAEVRVAYMYINLHKEKTTRETKAARESRESLAAPGAEVALVQVAETLDKRVQLANQIVKGVILPEFIILPIALALVWFALSRGLSPLVKLQQRIRSRHPGDLSSIDSGQVPEEIAPLVLSLNEMLERLSLSIEMQKRFIADAAHQMKTPLAGMRMQSELALRHTSQKEIHRSLLQLAKSSEAATRLVNQLLALARAENQTPEANRFVSLDLTELARDVVQGWVQASFTHQIDFGFEQSGHPLMVQGNPTMLREMLNNLIDNALRYTPPSGRVTVRVRADDEERYAILEVEDTGPGIPAGERTHVFERFYRILGSNADGSGLGLSIVREIAQQHGADIDIFSNPRSRDQKFPGCLFRVALPLKPDADAAAMKEFD
jgi:two-component system sensor histidine kinase TctE